MLEVGILKESLTFLLIRLLLIAVSCNPCFRIVLGYKSLGNKLSRNPKCLGVGSMGVWEGLEMKTKKKVGKPVGGI